MRIAKLAQRSAIIALLLAASALYAVTAAHADESQDTFLNGPDDTFTIDQDGPDQDPKYDTDDPKYDEMDDLDHDEDPQTINQTIDSIETFWI